MFLKRLFIVLIISLIFSSKLNASPSLIADIITVSEDGNVINARGNVEITYKKNILNADSISYNKKTDQIVAAGPLTYYDGHQTIIHADNGKFDKNFRNAILEETKFILADSLTIISTKIVRQDGLSNKFYKTYASTCNICNKNQVPLWEIRAERIEHDEKSKQIYFYRSQFRFLGVPLFYSPLLRLPDPSLKRAKGFLVPDIKYSKSSNIKIKMPYFIPLNKSSDLLLTPEINLNNSMDLGVKYRKLFYNSDLNIEGFVANGISSSKLNGYLFGNFNSKLNNNRKLLLQFQRASNLELIANHTEKNIRSTESLMEVTEQYNHFYGKYGIYDGIQLNPEITNSNMPNLNSRNNISYFFKPQKLGGQANMLINVDGYKRQSSIDGNLGRDALSANIALKWRRNFMKRSGGIIGLRSITSGNLKKYYDDSNQEKLLSQVRQISSLQYSMPFLRQIGSNSMFYEPKMQIIYSIPVSVSEPDEDSKTSELSYSNFDELNHSYGSSLLEKGLRLQSSLKNSYKTQKGTSTDLFIGNILKFNSNTAFHEGSGLGSSSSLNIGSLKFSFIDNFSVRAEVLADSNFKITRNNLQLDYEDKDVGLYSRFFFKPKNEKIGINNDRSELTVGTNYHINRKTLANLNFVYDSKTSSMVKSEISSKYKHDCMTLNLFISRDFRGLNSSNPGISLGAKFELFGSPTGDKQISFNSNKCRG